MRRRRRASSRRDYVPGDPTRLLKANTYRFVMTVGLQPPFAAELLAEQTAGTPQRFLWAAASDPGAPEVLPSWPGELAGRPAEVTSFSLDAEVRRIIQGRRRQANVEGGHEDPHESHATQIQLRVAAILAHLLDNGSRFVTTTNWTTAAQIVENSRNVRQELLRYHQETTTDDMVNVQATRMVLTDMARDVVRDQALDRIGNRMVRALAKNGTMTKAALQTDLHSRDRSLLADALARLLSQGVVIVEGSKFSLKSS